MEVKNDIKKCFFVPCRNEKQGTMYSAASYPYVPFLVNVISHEPMGQISCQFQGHYKTFKYIHD